MDYREQITQLRELADAMVIGALLRPQICFTLFDGHGTCALGAAYEGSGRYFSHPTNLHYEDIRDIFPVLELVAASNGDCLADAIVQRNDSLHQTREEIAAWLRGIAQSLDDGAPITPCGAHAADPCTTKTLAYSCR